MRLRQTTTHRAPDTHDKPAKKQPQNNNNKDDGPKSAPMVSESDFKRMLENNRGHPDRMIMPSSGPSQIQQQDNSDGGLKQTTDKINSLFRSGSGGNKHHKSSGSSALDGVPVIPSLTQQGGNNATHYNATLAYCFAVTTGACFDQTTGKVLP
jgi:hypothetical protein